MGNIDYKAKFEKAMEDIAIIRKANEDNTELVKFIDFNYPELKEPPTEMKALLWFLGAFPADYETNTANGVTVGELIAWLEEVVKPKLDSMRNPTEWKPTEEEMSAIYRMVYIDGCDDEFEKPLRYLYQDLKREFFDGVSIENMPWNNQPEHVTEKEEPEQCKIEKKSDYSEDNEKIGRQLLNWFKNCKWDAIDNETLKRDDIIAWLEKRVEQKSTYNWNELTWEDINTLEGIINNVHYEFRNGIGVESFGKEVLERFRETKGDEYMDSCEQKPAEWSEEDIRVIERACVALRAYANGDLPEYLPSELLGYADRLQSLKPQSNGRNER